MKAEAGEATRFLGNRRAGDLSAATGIDDPRGLA